MKKILTLSLSLFIVFTYTSLFSQEGEKDDFQNAAKIYNKYCRSCHGKNGDGNGPVGKNLKPKPPDFTDKEKMDEISNGNLYKTINGGGKAVGKSALMPSYGTKLKKKDIDDLVSYIRKFIHATP